MLSRLNQLTQSIKDEYELVGKSPSPVSVIEKNAQLLKTETPSLEEVVLEPADAEEIPELKNSKGPEKNQREQVSVGQINTSDNTKGFNAKLERTNAAPCSGSDAVLESASNAPNRIFKKDENILDAKLRRLQKFEDKYPQLLKAYRVEKKKNELVKLFERVLSENTPCRSIAEPQEMLNFIDQLNRKNVLLKEELEKTMLEFEQSKKQYTRDNENLNDQLKTALDRIEQLKVVRCRPSTAVQAVALTSGKYKQTQDFTSPASHELDFKNELLVGTLGDLRYSIKFKRSMSDSNLSQQVHFKKIFNFNKAKEELAAENKSLKLFFTKSEVFADELHDTSVAQLLQARDETILELRSMLEAGSNDILILKQEIGEIKRKAALAFEACEKAEDGKRIIEKQLRSSRTALEKEREKVAQIRIELTEAVARADREAEKTALAQANVKKITDKSTALQTEVSNLNAKVIAAETAHAAATHAQTTLKRQLDELKLRKNDQAGRNQRLHDEVAESRQLLDEKTQEVQTLKLQLDEHTNSTQSKLSEAEKSVDLLKKEKIVMEQELSALGERLVKDTDDLRSQLRVAVHGAKTAETNLKALEKEITSLRAENVRLANCCGPKPSIESNFEYVKRLKEANQEIDASTRANERLKRIADDMQERLIRSQKTNQALQAEIEALRTQHLYATRAESRIPKDFERQPRVNDNCSDSEKQLIYLKNVLVQFLENKGQRKSLFPVISTLLNLDASDETRIRQALN